MPDPDIIRLTTRTVYENAWLAVREDTVRRRDGSEGLYGIIERRDFVIVAAIEAGTIAMVEQFRYPVGARVWELPMGMWPDATPVAPQTLAATELAEETGLSATDWRALGTLWVGPGFCNQRGHLFLATGLTEGPPSRELSEQDMRAVRMPIPELLAMVADGRLQDGPSLAALGLLRLNALI